LDRGRRNNQTVATKAVAKPGIVAAGPARPAAFRGRDLEPVSKASPCPCIGDLLWSLPVLKRASQPGRPPGPDADGRIAASVPLSARVTGYGVSRVVDPDRVVHHVCFDVCFALAKRKILEGHVADGARSQEAA